MYLLVECVILVLLYTVIVIPSIAEDPVSRIYDYPEAIQYKYLHTHMDPDENKTKRIIIMKFLGCVGFIILLPFMVFIAGADNFGKGLLFTLILWNVIVWWDALIVDCLWFCHCKSIRLPGTEDMLEYQDYTFHISKSIKMSIMSVPLALIIGFIIFLIS